MLVSGRLSSAFLVCGGCDDRCEHVCKKLGFFLTLVRAVLKLEFMSCLFPQFIGPLTIVPRACCANNHGMLCFFSISSVTPDRRVGHCVAYRP